MMWRNTKYYIEKYKVGYGETQKIKGWVMVPAMCRVVGHKELVRGEGTCMHIANYYKYNS